MVSTTSAPQRWTARRILTRVGIYALTIYLGVLIVLTALQTQLIFPGRSTQGQPSARFQAKPGVELVRLLTAGGDEVAALFAPAQTLDGSPHPEAKSRPTFLYFYGNGMCLNYTADQVHLFRRLGVNVLAAEYVGYGMSSGSASEVGCYATADALYEHALTRPDINPQRLVTVGWSLGAAVAADLAARRAVVGLVMLSPFTSIADAAQAHYPILPIRLLLKYRFDNAGAVAKTTCPILIVHGRLDSIVPYAMSERLARIAPERTTHVPLDEADHNDTFDAGRDEITRRLRAWLETLP